MSESAPTQASAQEPEFFSGLVSELVPPSATAVAEDLREGLFQFLRPLLLLLDAVLDVRLARTLLATTEAILSFRHRNHGLLLSELGAYLLSPGKAPAGTKRLSNLLRSNKWTADLVSDWLWRQAEQRLRQLEETGKTALVLWDESVLEKPESREEERGGKTQGLCSVRSSKAKRLARSRPGPPANGGKPTFVNGFHWLCLLLVGMGGSPTVAAMRWFTTRGQYALDLRAVQAALLKRCALRLGRRVLHVCDRGYAGAPWLLSFLSEDLRLLVRWTKHLHLLDAQGKELPAWQVFRGQRSWEERVCWDAVHCRLRHLGILAALVSHPQMPNRPLWLVCARPGDGKDPWLLLTTEPANTADQAWELVLAYARRWQIEMCFRYNKSELAMESPRLWTLERRQKLLMIVTLCYAFLLSLLAEGLLTLRNWLLRHFCHRTGKRSRQTAAPLYRIRTAISRLWLDYPQPKGRIVNQSSG